jgi:VHL beta domain
MHTKQSKRLFALMLLLSSWFVSTAVHAQQPSTLSTCSIGAAATGTLKIENNTSQQVDVYWVNYQCQEQLYSTLPAGWIVTQQSYISHPWRVRERATGKLLKQVTVNSSAVRHIALNDECSGVIGGAAQTQFSNDLPFNVEVYWKDYGCQERLYAILAPGQSYVQATYANHAWRIRRADTKAILKDHQVDTTGLSVVPAGGRASFDRVDDSSFYQVKPVYVLPSDAPDRELDRDGAIVTSIAAGQKWLKQQAGGQGLRFDTYQGGLDVGFVRLAKTDAQMLQQAIQQYGSAAFLRDVIQAELHARGFNDPGTVYLAYYDGSTNFSCGGASLPPDGAQGNTVALYLRGTPPGAPACGANAFATNENAPRYWEFSGVHEVFHSLGVVAVPGSTGVPAFCSPNHTLAGHVSDNPSDLMYAGALPWSPSVLDFGRNDYFGHGNPSCPDLARSVFMSPAAANAVPPLGWL